MLLRAKTAVRENWPEYLMEASGLAIIMLVSAGITVFAQAALPAGWPNLPRRMVEGVAIGGTVVTLVYSPWGMRSGAHYNPAVTLTFFTLGRVKPIDAALYVLFQLAGAVLGILVAGLLMGSLLADPPTVWIVTQPGAGGVLVAFLAEFAVAFLAMETILVTGGSPGLARFTGAFVGVLIFLFVSFEAPLSGFSMNPARSFGSAIVSGRWTAFWIYVLAPPAGMLAAAFLNRSIPAWSSTTCAKLVRNRSQRCIHCGFTPSEDAASSSDPRCKMRRTS